ncbi:MAG: IgGFc-binding protein [Planctomycetota bacterium]
MTPDLRPSFLALGVFALAPLFRPLAVLTLLVPMALSLPATAQTHLGQEFWLSDTRGVSMPFTISVANPSGSTASISIYNVLEGTTTASLASGAVSTFSFPQHEATATGTTITLDTVYRVTSNVDVSVVAHDPVFDVSNNESCLVLPVPTLGLRHRIASYWQNWKDGRTFAIVVAASPGTTSVQLFDAAETLVENVSLTQGEAFHRIVSTDMTGWEIVADQPVAVFSGNESTKVGPLSCCNDPLVEQLLPETKLALAYVVAPLRTRPINCTTSPTCSADLFRFVATQDGTTLTTTPNVGGGTLNAGDTLEFATSTPFLIQGNQPFFGYQYLPSFSATFGSSPAANFGDPSLVTMIAPADFRRSYLVQIDPTFLGFLNVIAPAGANLLLDGSPITPAWDYIGTLAGVSYGCMRIPVSSGSHKLFSPNRRIGLVVSGFSGNGSFAHLGGLGDDCPPTPDGWIRDADDDDGSEPDPSTAPLWNSPDIWVRHQQDSALQFAHQHQNPVPSMQNWVYVKLRNRSCQPLASGAVHLCFTTAGSSPAWPTNWSGNPLAGDLVGIQPVTYVVEGGETVLEFPWTPPVGSQFGLLARYVATSDPMTFAEVASTLANVKNNNNIAWKSVVALELQDVTTAPTVTELVTFTVGHLDTGSALYDLTFGTPDDLFSASFLAHGTLELTLPPGLFASWELAGAGSHGLEQRAVTTSFVLTSPSAGLRGIAFSPGESHALELAFRQTRAQRLAPLDCDPLVFRQLDAATGEVEGGMTFEVTGHQAGKGKARPQ